MTDIFYTKDHEWIKVNGDEGVVGITSYASEQLGDIVSLNYQKKETLLIKEKMLQ